MLESRLCYSRHFTTTNRIVGFFGEASLCLRCTQSQDSPFPTSVLERLGGGGKSVVFKRKTPNSAALSPSKSLSGDLTHDPHAYERFRHEAPAASALNHPNTCTVYEVGEQQGNLFIAMECLEGHSLRKVLEGAPLDLDRMLELAIEIADALDAAHARGIVHRDIKAARPWNSFLKIARKQTPHGRPTASRSPPVGLPTEWTWVSWRFRSSISRPTSPVMFLAHRACSACAGLPTAVTSPHSPRIREN